MLQKQTSSQATHRRLRRDSLLLQCEHWLPVRIHAHKAKREADPLGVGSIAMLVGEDFGGCRELSRSPSKPPAVAEN